MKLEIETKDENLVQYLREASRSHPASAVEVPTVGTLRVDFSDKSAGMLPGLSEVFGVTLTFASGVTASIAANWLYDKLKGRTQRVRIEEKTVEVDREGLTRLVSRYITVED